MLEIGNDFYINIKPRLPKNELYNFSDASTDTYFKNSKITTYKWRSGNKLFYEKTRDVKPVKLCRNCSK